MTEELKSQADYFKDEPIYLRKVIEELEQENKELKEVKEQLKKWNDENLKRQDDMQLWIDLAEEQRKNYRSALEDIRDYLYTLTTVNGDFINTETYLRINDKIEEVLNEDTTH